MKSDDAMCKDWIRILRRLTIMCDIKYQSVSQSVSDILLFHYVKQARFSKELLPDMKASWDYRQ